MSEFAPTRLGGNLRKLEYTALATMQMLYDMTSGFTVLPADIDAFHQGATLDDVKNCALSLAGTTHTTVNDDAKQFLTALYDHIDDTARNKGDIDRVTRWFL